MIQIGITGHRPHRLTVSHKRLGRRVNAVLSGLIKAASKGGDNAVLEIVSPLAEGCDRIVAHQALALGQRLSAVIPFEPREYESTFSDAATTIDFRRLWKASHSRAVLHGSLSRAQAGYIAVGMVTLARSDLVLTIWDGKPAQGRGGTPEILQTAVELGIPVIWVHATIDRPPVLLTKPLRGKALPHLERIARRGAPLAADRYREIVALVTAAASP